MINKGNTSICISLDGHIAQDTKTRQGGKHTTHPFQLQLLGFYSGMDMASHPAAQMPICFKTDAALVGLCLRGSEEFTFHLYIHSQRTWCFCVVHIDVLDVFWAS